MSGRDWNGGQNMELGRPAPALAAPASAQAGGAALVIGELVGIADGGRTPMVMYPGQPGSAALAAATLVDLHAAHVGCRVALQFDGGDGARPVVMGVLREAPGWPLADPPGQVEVDVDGARMVVSAKEQLVLRCGAASITLTKAGEVLIRGSYVLTRSTGVNRIAGGAVQLN
jgi:hypothetical protein